MFTLANLQSKLIHLIDSRASDEFVRRTNEALERLWGMGTFWGMMELRRVTPEMDRTGEADLNVIYVDEKEAIIGLQPVENGVPVTIWSLFNEYHPVGAGRVNKYTGIFADMGRVAYPDNFDASLGILTTYNEGAFAATSTEPIHGAALGATAWYESVDADGNGNPYFFQTEGTSVEDAGTFEGYYIYWSGGRWRVNYTAVSTDPEDEDGFSNFELFRSSVTDPGEESIVDVSWEPDSEFSGTFDFVSAEYQALLFSDYDNPEDYAVGDHVWLTQPDGELVQIPHEGVVLVISFGGMQIGNASGSPTWMSTNEEGEIFNILHPDFEEYRLAGVAHGYKVPLGDDEYWALVKTAPGEVLNDSDEVPISNIGAMKLAIMATIYEDTNDLERAASYWENAVTILNQELAMLRTGTTNPIPVTPEGPGGEATPSFY